MGLLSLRFLTKTLLLFSIAPAVDCFGETRTFSAFLPHQRDGPRIAVLTEPDACDSDERAEETFVALQNALSSECIDLVSIRVENDYSRSEIFQARLTKLVKSVSDLKRNGYPGFVLVVNDNVQAAIDGEADGVHVKEKDAAKISAIRDMIKERSNGTCIIGTSCHSIESALRANEYMPDYLFVGTCFPTQTHPDKIVLEGPALPGNVKRALAKDLKDQSHSPIIFAIGGINEFNAKEPIDLGADGVAAIRSILCAENPTEVSQAIKAATERNKSHVETKEMSDDAFANLSNSGEIPSYDGDAKAKATDFANYFSSYAELFHQKQMLADHNRMASYHQAIMGNASVFKDKVVMDVGTGSGILAVWAALAGARKVYAIEYTDMAKHARELVEANGVSDIVTVIQGAVEEIDLPIAEHCLETEEEGTELVVDIMISEWMGYFLLRESMLDSLIRARDKYLKKKTGLMFPSHSTIYVAPVRDEADRKQSVQEYNDTMSDWNEFVESTRTLYGVDMSILEKAFDKEQKEYYTLSSRWAELMPDQVLAEPKAIKVLDMMTCTIEDSRGISKGDPLASFDFDINADEVHGCVSGLAAWFTSNFKSRTDEGGSSAPELSTAILLSTAPENGYTHWGQQVMHFVSSIPLSKGETTRLNGSIELTRTKENARLYNCRINFRNSRRKTGQDTDSVLMQGAPLEHIYQIP